MKHKPSITALLLLTFLLAQFVGLWVVYNYIDVEKTAATGKTMFKELPVGERPPVEEKTSFVPIMIAILIGTGILLLLIKFRLEWLWKTWFFIAIVIALTIAFSAFTIEGVAFVLALVLGAWKLFRPNFWVQNLTELFIYGGLAAIFVPLFNLFSVVMLMILIAGYDAYAVWKSKHMIMLAQSQAKAKMFAGLLIPYKMGSVGKMGKVVKGKAKQVVEQRTAILGGGDIGFPLIFAGVVLKEMGVWQSLVIPFFAMAALGLLLYKADEKKFYPAMPFISAGCFLGLAVVWAVGLMF